MTIISNFPSIISIFIRKLSILSKQTHKHYLWYYQSFCQVFARCSFFLFLQNLIILWIYLVNLAIVIFMNLRSFLLTSFWLLFSCFSIHLITLTCLMSKIVPNLTILSTMTIHIWWYTLRYCMFQTFPKQ
jgi:hypothetical protein